MHVAPRSIGARHALPRVRLRGLVAASELRGWAAAARDAQVAAARRTACRRRSRRTQLGLPGLQGPPRLSDRDVSALSSSAATRLCCQGAPSRESAPWTRSAALLVHADALHSAQQRPARGSPPCWPRSDGERPPARACCSCQCRALDIGPGSQQQALEPQPESWCARWAAARPLPVCARAAAGRTAVAGRQVAARPVRLQPPRPPPPTRPRPARRPPQPAGQPLLAPLASSGGRLVGHGAAAGPAVGAARQPRQL